ncbi:MAG: DUF177 domain-containing protein [Sediminibacterium sp.]|nr:DUF177 domain-containing protein [Sediminibacterium sp.]
MGKKEYIIQFSGLSIGNHEFEFKITGTFFEQFEDSEIERADIAVKATLVKQNYLMQLLFDIEGTVGIACDRCLKDFDFPVEMTEKLVVKHGNPDESNDEILVIPEGASEIQLSQYLYEYIMVSIPARRVPCEIDEEQFKCDTETLQRLNQISTSEERSDEELNPLWVQLNKLKDNKN